MAASMNVPSVELGFVEKSDGWRLASHYFPSKVGGRPAWLSLRSLPEMKSISCKTCQKQCIFLLQVYCPVDDNDSCFHRTLFLFVCRNLGCHGDNLGLPFLVFRSQLPRKNDFFEYDPLDEEHEVSFLPTLEKHGVNLCRVCGCDAGNKNCSKCHTVYYCSREHQLLHWKNGHKASCCKVSTEGWQPMSPGILFPEFDIITEPEPSGDDPTSREDKNVDIPVGDPKEIDKYSSEELEKMAMKETKDDKHFLSFKERVNIEPEQILRYQRGGEPLWVSRHHQPGETDIPPCSCGSRRIFEFQVMPQLLLHLNVDSLDDGGIDWGTLVVYTCEASCNEGKDYHEEFIWKQDYEKKLDEGK